MSSVADGPRWRSPPARDLVGVRLLDHPDSPSGREDVTQRPAWRIEFEPGRRGWAFVEEIYGRPTITGYPQHRVRRVPRESAGAAVVGAGAGAAIGAAVAGPPGAILGGLFGFLLGSGAKTS